MLTLIITFAALGAAQPQNIATHQLYPRSLSGAATAQEYGSFTADLRVRQIADRSTFTITTRGKSLRAFFGNLHAHTAQSDGTGDAGAAIRFAKTVARLDFFALTDHAEYWELARDATWDEQRRLADANTDETFVVLPGFEYSHPIFGHYVVLNSRRAVSSVTYPRLADFYRWLAADHDALAIFAHPGFHQSHVAEFAGYAFDGSVFQNMIGIEVLHWDGYRRFIETPAGVPYIDQASSAGWHVGSIAAQDNHGADWGLAGNNRIGVLLPSLSKDNLVAALKARTFYATNSPALQLSTELCFRENCAQMGGSLATQAEQSLQLLVNLFDPNATVPARFEVMLDGEVVASHVSDHVESASWRHDFIVPQELGRHWLYVRVYQGESGFSQSSPIRVLN